MTSKNNTVFTASVMEFPMSDITSKNKTGPNAVGHKSIVTAVATALIDLVSQKGQLPPLKANVRLDGKTALVTGANSGLGKAVAIDLAKRGARVLMVCRSGIPDAGEEVKRLSGSTRVDMLKVDLADLNSVSRLCDQLRNSGVVLDIAVMNAGLMPLQARRSAQGHEIMFAVHFLANRLMLARWLKDGVIRPRIGKGEPPRVIFVSSEAHQSSAPIDFDHFGAFVDYGMKDGMKHYGMSKLHLSTFVAELSRRINGAENDATSSAAVISSAAVKVAVHSLCPGPIASNIARESPTWIKPILGPIMKAFFRSPEKAAEPVILLAAAPEFGKRTGVYLHMMREKLPSSLTLDADNGALLWQKSEAMLTDFLPKETPVRQGSAVLAE